MIGSLPNRIALAVNASMYTYANPNPLAASFCSAGISSLYVFLYSSSASLPNCSAPDAYPSCPLITLASLYPGPAASSALARAAAFVNLPVLSAATAAFAALATPLASCTAFTPAVPGSINPPTYAKEVVIASGVVAALPKVLSNPK